MWWRFPMSVRKRPYFISTPLDPELTASQFAPRSTLLKIPPGNAPAYDVLGFCGSTASARIEPAPGPWLVHTLVPAQTVRKPVATMASNITRPVANVVMLIMLVFLEHQASKELWRVTDPRRRFALDRRLRPPHRGPASARPCNHFDNEYPLQSWIRKPRPPFHQWTAPHSGKGMQ